MNQITIKSIKDIPESLYSDFAIPKNIEKQVTGILNKVKVKGDKALLNYTAKFDKVKLSPRSIKIPKSKLRTAWQKTPLKIKKALNEAKNNIQKYHTAQLPFQWELRLKKGVTLGQTFRPIERVGVYIPGGTAPLVSTVLMTVLPARTAGISEIILVTPPKPNKYILAAAYITGATDVYQIGGAQAIAALAYGTETIPKVDKIIGPGNIYVTCAKKLVFGTVNIDMLAGPSEILIIADKTANPEYIAADLLSQLEHDELSKAILITDSPKIYKETVLELEKQQETLKRKKIISKSKEKGLWIIKVPSIKTAVELSNKIAPEHLELMVKNPEKLTKKIKNAGIILLGSYSPVATADFIAGTNHVLPTGGTAKSFSGLNIWNFLKPTGNVKYTKEALSKIKPYIETFAKIEKLDAHAKSVDIRR